jgi:hypothetical protein
MYQEKQETVTLTLGEIFNRVHRSEDFHKIGINEWCLNEGLGTRESRQTLSKEEALVFMGEDEFNDRKNETI